jgi:hypothetical protein
MRAVTQGDNNGLPTVSADALAVLAKGAEGQHIRTDFVILLMWQEPTPSDELRKLGNRK